MKEQYVFTITDGGFAKRSRISEYRITNRGGLGIKAMALANEDRGQLVGAFIVEEGDEILSITGEARRPGVKAMRSTNEERGGLVGAFIVEDGDEVRSPRAARSCAARSTPTSGRPDARTMGVKFVTPKPATRSPSSPARSRPRSTRKAPRRRGATHADEVVDESVDAGDSPDDESCYDRRAVQHRRRQRPTDDPGQSEG